MSNCIFRCSLTLKKQVLDVNGRYLQILTAGCTNLCVSTRKKMQRWRKKSHLPSDSSAGRVLALTSGFRCDIVNKHYKQTINRQARRTEQSGNQWSPNRGMWLAQVYQRNKCNKMNKLCESHQVYFIQGLMKKTLGHAQAYSQ